MDEGSSSSSSSNTSTSSKLHGPIRISPLQMEHHHDDDDPSSSSSFRHNNNNNTHANNNHNDTAAGLFRDVSSSHNDNTNIPLVWSPSGSWWRDMLHFVGPGWFVSIAYVDPGNYQADIQAGATNRYALLSIVWWTSLLSIYVQILCVRLTYYGHVTLAEAQARHTTSNAMRYVNWFLAEFATVITDLPEVIGIGIACNTFFGWPYYVGVVLSLLTTMTFLATLHCGVRILEGLVFVFVAIMSIALMVELAFVQPNTTELLEGWFTGFTDLQSTDIFAITGVVGAVVMPHNLYLHTAACQARPVQKQHVRQAVKWSSWEPVVPIVVSFGVNLCIVAIAAEQVYGQPNAAAVGLTDFCQYFSSIKGGCTLWGIALLAAGQSSAITTTYTGQYVMDGFLNMQLPVHWRAIVTRLVAITPCILVSILLPHQLNRLVNMVNSSLSFLLPFAFTPLVKFNCSPHVLGEHASTGWERILLYTFAIAVWGINAVALSVPGGGFLGDLRARMEGGTAAYIMVVMVEIAVQVFYAWWNWHVLTMPLYGPQELPQSEESADDDEDDDGNTTMMPDSSTMIMEQDDADISSNNNNSREREHFSIT